MIGCLCEHAGTNSSLAGNPSFLDLLARVSRGGAGAYAHTGSRPLEKLVEELEPQPRCEPLPSSRCSSAAKHTAAPRAVSGSLALSALPLPQHSAKFDLSLAINESSQGLVCELEYTLDLFEARKSIHACWGIGRR